MPWTKDEWNDVRRTRLGYLPTRPSLQIYSFQNLTNPNQTAGKTHRHLFPLIYRDLLYRASHSRIKAWSSYLSNRSKNRSTSFFEMPNFVVNLSMRSGSYCKQIKSHRPAWVIDKEQISPHLRGSYKSFCFLPLTGSSSHVPIVCLSWSEIVSWTSQQAPRMIPLTAWSSRGSQLDQKKSRVSSLEFNL